MTLKPPDGTNDIVLSANLQSTEDQVLSLWSFLTPLSVLSVPTPTQTLTAIHNGLDWSAETGGVLEIPITDEPWEVNGTIIPPPNSSMKGPVPQSLIERQSRSGHGAAFYQLPPVGETLGGAWIKLASGSNCPLFATDYTNVYGKRGPDRGNNAYWQWFKAWNITFDHNGRNQTATTSNGTGDTHTNTTVDNVTGTWAPGDPIVNASIPEGTYVKTVVGTTLTLTAATTGTAAGVSLSKGMIAMDIRHAWGVNFYDCDLRAPRGHGWFYYRCNECNGHNITTGGDIDEVLIGTGDSTVGLSTILNATGTWVEGDRITALPGFPYGTYVRTVAGSTLTLASSGALAVATSTVTGMNLYKPTFQADHLLSFINTTTDCEWSNSSMHGARLSSLLIDTSRGMVISGLFGFAIGGGTSGAGYNAWLKNSFAGDCINNQISGRLDQASGHNCRIDINCKSNQVDTTDFSPGMYNRTADADGGWVNIYCDGVNNDLGGVGTKGWGAESNMANLGALGTSAKRNICRKTGGHDLAAQTRLWRLASGVTALNTVVGQVEFGIPASVFSPLTGTPAMTTYNTDSRVLAFDAAATETAETTFVIPDGIQYMNLRLILVNLNAGVSGNVRMQLGIASIGVGAGTALGADQETWLATVAIPASSAHVTTSFAGLVRSDGGGNLCSLRVRRMGADAADTLAADLGLLALRVEPFLI